MLLNESQFDHDSIAEVGTVGNIVLVLIMRNLCLHSYAEEGWELVLDVILLK